MESVPSAVEDARRNADALGLGAACEFLLADAEKAAAQLAAAGTHIDIAVADPPRKGCGEETLRALLTMAPEHLVMISCNAATLARDLKFLTQNGYRAGAVTPVDLFPNTAHVETVVLMSRADK